MTESGKSIMKFVTDARQAHNGCRNLASIKRQFLPLSALKCFGWKLFAETQSCRREITNGLGACKAPVRS